MKIAVFGTGMVGRTIAEKLVANGHSVVLGTRDPQVTVANDQGTDLEPVSFKDWYAQHQDVEVASFKTAATAAELIANATGGAVSLKALEAAGAEAIGDKTILDLALPLDMSEGMPPKILASSEDSLGEQIQRAFPQAKVVKTLNTVYKEIMVNPSLAGESQTLFISGNDEQAKATVLTLLAEFGWVPEKVLDLGGIESARGTEMAMRLYFQVALKLGTFEFNLFNVNR